METGKLFVPVLAIVGGFSLAAIAFKWAQGYMNKPENAPGGPGPGGVGRFRLGEVLRTQSEWEKNKMAQGLLMTLG